MKKLITLLAALTLVIVPLKAQESMQTQKPAGPVVDIETTMGPIKVMLYDDTPLHRDNFLKLAENGDYDGVLFHRVIDQFMVQTGDPDSKEAPKDKVLGEGQVGDDIPAEIVFPKHFHKYGALAAARMNDDVNPQRRSSGSQFYIVTGRTMSDMELNQLEMKAYNNDLRECFKELTEAHMSEIRAFQEAKDREGLEALRQQLIKETEQKVVAFKFPEEIRELYKTQGGTPHLDNAYTVFGEVIEGMETVEKIQKAATDGNDRPIEDIRVISMKVER